MTGSQPPARKSVKWLWIALAGLAALAAALAFGAVASNRNLEVERSRVAEIAAERDGLIGQTVRLRESLASIEHSMEELAAGGNQEVQAALRRQRESEKARSIEAATAGQYMKALSEAKSQNDELAKRVVALEQDLAAMRREMERAHESGAELESRQESAQRLIAALQEQVKSKERTLASLEAAYQRYKDANQESSRQIEIVSKTIAGLEDLNRNRLRVLEQASRRMRELGDSLRTMSVRIDTDSRGQSGMGTDLNRIQSTATMLDDQIAQMTNLNAQAASLEKRLQQARGSN